MIGIEYPTKKALKAAIGTPLVFDLKPIDDGQYVVVGPLPYRRDKRPYYADVTVKDGLITKVV